MTEKQYQRQMEVIIEGSAELRKSKETARQFLIDVGIIEEKKKKKTPSKKK